jgi:phosphatidylglycerophosphate synthase
VKTSSMSDAKPENLTIAQAWRATDTSRDVLVVRYITRPLSAIVMPVFFNAGLTANQVTYGRIVVGVAVLFASLCNQNFLPVVAAWAVLDYVADCVDGGLARLRDQATYWGKYIDGIVDVVGIFLLPVFVGIMTGDVIWISIGAATAIASVVGQFVRTRYAFFRQWMLSESDPLSEQQLTLLARLQRYESFCLGWRVNFGFLFLLLLFAGEHYFIVASALVVLPLDLAAGGLVIAQAHAIMRRHRVSAHDTRCKKQK